MAIYQTGNLALQVFIGGTEIPLGIYVDCYYVHINCSTKTGVPMLHLKLTDSIDFVLASNILYDGSPITISIGVPDIRIDTYRFKMNSFTTGPTSATRLVEIDAYLDNSKYWNYVSSTPIKATSSEAIRSIAEFCGMNFVGNSTSDTQVWYPLNNYLYEFAQNIAKHGYIKDGSCMVVANDIKGTIVYKDISSSLRDADYTVSIGEQVEGSILATDFSASVRSGSLNHLSGYSGTTSVQSVLNSNRRFVAHIVVPRGATNRLMVNATEFDEVQKGSSRVNLTPISSGNEHANYEIAKYQNARLSGAFAVSGELLFTYPLDVSILDTLKVVVSNDQRPYLRQYSANYKVTGRVVFTDGKQYYEKLAVNTFVGNLSPGANLK